MPSFPRCKRVIILPGNGCADVHSANWYAELKNELWAKFGGSVECVLKDMPDPHMAKESEWIPFIKNVMKVDEETVVVGHSSGAVCCMRLMETTKIGAAVLVSTCYTDLGNENERASGYFSREWDWGAMRRNCPQIHQFHSDDDHLIPVKEARFVARSLKGGGGEEFTSLTAGVDEGFTYQELAGHGHFFSMFPEVLDVVVKCL